ncbi:hypothetical protein PR048_000120 [Dryococelus australis]|uniref:Reverse transcriptase/retrotransposon-derived protein RNase H-like domain-containing protein n=1 Tax=Dryococelus australis TaxID=614101 RepID=A0ABQ9IDR2_9NEOP|nr:hypothetical protein PR048_000120 [Dryococelus australis]
MAKENTMCIQVDLNPFGSCVHYSGHVADEGNIRQELYTARIIVEYPQLPSFQVCVSFLDEIRVYSNTFEERFDSAKQVFMKLRSAGFMVNQENVSRANNQITILGPLNHLKKKWLEFRWGEEQQRSFHALKKKAILYTAALRLPKLDEQFVLQVDASSRVLQAVLLQENDSGFSAYEKYALACFFGIEKFAAYLENAEFDLMTDNQAVPRLFSHPRQLGKLGSWRMNDPSEFVVLPEALDDPGIEALCNILHLNPESFVNVRKLQKENAEMQLVLKSFREKHLSLQMILRYFYDSPVVAYIGNRKTELKIRKEVFWPNMHVFYTVTHEGYEGIQGLWEDGKRGVEDLWKSQVLDLKQCFLLNGEGYSLAPQERWDAGVARHFRPYGSVAASYALNTYRHLRRAGFRVRNHGYTEDTLRNIAEMQGPGGGGEREILEKNLSTSGIIQQHDSHMPKTRGDPAGNRTRFTMVGGKQFNHYTPPGPKHTCIVRCNYIRSCGFEGEMGGGCPGSEGHTVLESDYRPFTIK